MTQAVQNGVPVLDAYESCEALTRSAAANFYYGIRLLPPDKRRAMCAVYAFARRVDDIGDGHEPDARKLELLTDARADLASSNGSLCLAIFGSTDIERGDRLADDLGVAMQLTNILRDVREDLDNGRVDLPAEDLRRFGCEDLRAAPPDGFARLISFEADRAREWFHRGLGLLDLVDGRSASCVAAMTGIYRRILDRIDRSPEVVLDHGVSLPPGEKTWVTIRSLTGARR